MAGAIIGMLDAGPMMSIKEGQALGTSEPFQGSSPRNLGTVPRVKPSEPRNLGTVLRD